MFHIVSAFDASEALSAGCEYRELPLLQPHAESVEMSFTLKDAHLGSALVRDVVTQSTLYKIWLPHIIHIKK